MTNCKTLKCKQGFLKLEVIRFEYDLGSSIVDIYYSSACHFLGMLECKHFLAFKFHCWNESAAPADEVAEKIHGGGAI